MGSSSLTKDGTPGSPCWGREVLATGPWGKSPKRMFRGSCLHCRHHCPFLMRICERSSADFGKISSILFLLFPPTPCWAALSCSYSISWSQAALEEYSWGEFSPWFNVLWEYCGFTRVLKENHRLVCCVLQLREPHPVCPLMKVFQTSWLVQWLRLYLPVQWLWVRSLVRKLRSDMPFSHISKQATEAIL